MTTKITAFNLLLGELGGVLDPAAMERARVVFAGWAGQEVYVPAPREWLAEAAEAAARRMLASRTDVPLVRDRLMGMGITRSSAYRIIRRVSKEVHHAGNP